jgi:hypothetical protein
MVEGWKRLHNECFITCALHQILFRVIEACNAQGKMKNVYSTLVGNSEGKRPLRRHKHRWEDNIKGS